MRKFVALALMLIMALNLSCIAVAEGNSIPFDPVLTAGFQDELSVSDASGWMINDQRVAIFATLLALDVIEDDTVEQNMDGYKVRNAFVGVAESGNMLVVYRKDEGNAVLVIAYDPHLKLALISETVLGGNLTDQQMENVMKEQCVEYKKVDPEAAAEVARIILDALED